MRQNGWSAVSKALASLTKNIVVNLNIKKLENFLSDNCNIAWLAEQLYWNLNCCIKDYLVQVN